MARTQVPEEGQRVQNISELKNLKPRAQAVIRTEGAASRNDGLSNLYWWDPNGVATNANGTTIISSNVSGYTSGDPDEGVWRRMFKPSSEIESQIEKSVGNQGAVQYSDGSDGFLGNANYLYVDDSNATVGIGTTSPNTSVALEIAGTTEISNNTIQGNGGNLNLVEPYLNAFGGGKYGFNSNGDPVIKDASNDTRYVANDNGATVLTNGNVQVADSLSVGQTSSPSFTLDVNGNANISLNLNVGGDATVSGALNVQDFTFDQDSGDLVLSDSNGVELIRQPKGGPTQFVQGAEIGSIETPTDSFTQVINAPSTSAAASGDPVGYTFAVDNQSILEVKADADGSGGITNKRVSFASGVGIGGLAGDGLVSSGGNLNVRLPIENGGSTVTDAYAFNFGNQISVFDDGSNQVTVSHANISSADSSNTLPTVIRSVSTDGNGHVTGLSTGTFNPGTDIGINGNTINHANTGAADSSNSGSTVLQSLSTDGRGHVDSIGTATFSGGDGLSLNGTTFNVRLDIDDGGSNIASAYAINFASDLNVLDDGSNQVTVEVDSGSGSGLNADQVDGYDASDFFIQQEDNFATFNDRTGTGGNWRFGVISDGRIQLDHTNNFGQDFLTADRDNDSLSTDVDFGVGTNSPSYKLDVTGTIHGPRLNLENQESANNDGDIIRDNSVGFIGKWGGNSQAVFWDSNNVSTGSNLTVNGGTGQESQPDISIVNNPQFPGSQIGLKNDPDVFVYEDSNNASGPYWNNEDKLEIRGDGSVSGIELEAGYMHATQAAHVSGPIRVDDEVNFSGSFNVEYNSNSESLDFIYTG